MPVRFAQWGKSRRVGLRGKVIEVIREYGGQGRYGEGVVVYQQKRKPAGSDLHASQSEGIPHALCRALVTLNAN